MREIKFRGFSETLNKWVIGVPYFSEGNWWILVDENTKSEDIGTGSYFVDKNSIGQYIGLKDKNDTEIYKDDLLQDDKSRLFQVVEDIRISHTGYLMCCIKNKSENDHIQIGRFYEFYSWLYPDNSLEIIGNIYENPELLKVTQ